MIRYINKVGIGLTQLKGNAFEFIIQIKDHEDSVYKGLPAVMWNYE